MKTAKNRAKRQKKKARATGKGAEKEGRDGAGAAGDAPDVPLKKRRLISGKELVFRRPGEESDGEGDEDEDVGPAPAESTTDSRDDPAPDAAPLPIVDAPRITIIEEDPL